METFEDLQERVLVWAEDKDLLDRHNSFKQFGKFVEEALELHEEMISLHELKNWEGEITQNYTIDEDFKRTVKVYSDCLKMEFGDVLVTLIILAEQLGIDPVGCLRMAYSKIAGRQGKTIDGVFVKEEDLNND